MGSCMMKEIDLNSVKIEDLSFSVPFSIRSRRNDYVHALVAYFTVEFSPCHKRTGFSTGPESRYTHWKQTVFYLHDCLTIKYGERINGEFSVTQNKRKKRDLDIKLKYDFAGEVMSMSDQHSYKMR